MKLSPLRQRDAALPGLGKQTVGNALVVHLAEGMSAQAHALALGVAADTEHDLVVLDLPADSPISMWELAARVLPRRRRGVRLVIGGRARETTALAGQWLAERINRPVLAPDGPVFPGAGGGLFVHSGRDSGWVRFQPGRAPKWEAKRFPRPAWDCEFTAEQTPTSSRGVAEPLPGGLWVRPAGFDSQQRHHRMSLIRNVPAQHDVLTIVLGSPGCPPLSLDDAARLWVSLPESVRATARFARFGPMSVPAGTTLGQALADLLGERVRFYTGLPVGSPAEPAVSTVLFDGRLGWYTYACEVGYQPRAAAGGPNPVPELLGHRVPVDGLDEVSPGVYWYAPDAVIEVVRSGLLVRPPQDGPSSHAVRALEQDPSVHNLTFDAPDEGAIERMRFLAQDVLARLDGHTRRMTRVLAGTALVAERSRPRATTRVPGSIDTGRPATREEPPANVPGGRGGGPATAEVAAPVPTSVEVPVPPPEPPAGMTAPAASPVAMPVAPVEATGIAEALAPAEVAVPESPDAPETPVPVKPAEVRVQPTPSAEASALLPRRGVDKEREWLRKTLGAEYGLMSNAVARVLSEHPGFQGALSTSSPEVLADAVAVRLYLSAKGSVIDTGLRGGANGPHVPIARCVVAGLSRLPTHRGLATFGTSLPEQGWRLLEKRKLLTEWGFLNTLTRPSSTVDGDTDVLLWSITARRTRLLEPAEDGVTDRVLFVPGTNFKVLDLRRPAGSDRGLVLLRELTSNEVDEDGRVAADRVSLDELATASLRRAHETWADTEDGAGAARSVVSERAAARFGTVPGLV